MLSAIYVPKLPRQHHPKLPVHHPKLPHHPNVPKTEQSRMAIWLHDLRETVVPSVMEWHLMQCDVNRDLELTIKAQITLPDIQLKYADRVFRLYVKSLHNKAVYRAEELLSLKQLLPEALDCILNPNKSLHEKLDLLISRTRPNIASEKEQEKE